MKVEDSNVPPTIFSDLVELEAEDAETIYTTLLYSIYNVGFDINYLKSNLIAFCSDGVRVMLGRKSGTSSRLLKDFPGTIIWHC